jgi:hypothetical protein
VIGTNDFLFIFEEQSFSVQLKVFYTKIELSFGVLSIFLFVLRIALSVVTNRGFGL